VCETKEDLDFCVAIRYMYSTIGFKNDLSHDRVALLL
jgi:hypothetical protein